MLGRYAEVDALTLGNPVCIFLAEAHKDMKANKSRTFGVYSDSYVHLTGCNATLIASAGVIQLKES